MSKLEMAFYRALFAVHLGWPFSRLRCRLNAYSKWHDGRCQFCGVKHSLHWHIYKQSAQGIDEAAKAAMAR